MPQCDRTELKYLIALSMVPLIGPVTARTLIDKIGSARAVFDQKKEVLEKIDGIGPHLSGSIHSSNLLAQVEKEMEFLERHHIAAWSFKDPEYPQRLNECRDGPILLYTRGDHHLNPVRSISVVGTRKASAYGRDLCRQIIRDLATVLPDLVIVSGLAYGIDVIAHRAALESGLPTVAVLAHGFSTLYPPSHRETAKRIIRQGALVTDFDSGMGPERNNFLRRNRIIAGLSDATLVVESARKGGALITARMASSYSRDVLAVPGRVGDERSEGCNGLIKSQLAGLVESAPDILRCLNWGESRAPGGPPLLTALQAPEISPTEMKLLQAMEKAPGISPGILSQLTGTPVSEILALLLEMELKEWISVEPGNRYRTRIHAMVSAE
jgi:DNA processing protein